MDAPSREHTCFFFNDTATTEIYTLSLHDALPISMTAAKKLVQRGMNKQEVIQILGKPHSTSFNPYGEQWEYLKSSLLDYDHKIFVSFDRNGRVISYQDRKSVV